MEQIGFLDASRPGRNNTTPVSTAKPLPVAGQRGNFSTAGTPTTWTPTTSNQQIAPANANRRYGVVSNDSNVKVYLRFGGTAATAAAWAIVLQPGATYELPPGLNTAVQMLGSAAGTGLVGFQDVTD